MINRYIHPLGWLAFYLYQISEDLVDGSFDVFGFTLSTTFTISMIVCFYFFYPRVWKATIEKKHYWKLILFVPTGVAIFIGTRFLLEEVILRSIIGYGNYRDPYQLGYIIDNLFRPISIILLSLAAWLLKRQSELKENRAILEREKTAAELGFLRSQINPHFLFNTLGFIQSKLFKADPEAAEITTELSTVLRRAFSVSELEKTSVADEMEIVYSLHGIMRKRFDGKCFVEFHIDEKALQLQIEPLLLMPLAENMFKHGDLRSEDSPGEVRVQRNGKGLIIRFSNDLMSGKPHEGSGIGLENTSKRLNLVYPDNHSLEFKSEGGKFIVDIRIFEL